MELIEFSQLLRDYVLIPRSETLFRGVGGKLISEFSLPFCTMMNTNYLAPLCSAVRFSLESSTSILILLICFIKQTVFQRKVRRAWLSIMAGRLKTFFNFLHS